LKVINCTTKVHVLSSAKLKWRLHCDRCGGDVVSKELNDQLEPFLVFRRGHQCPNKLFVYSFKYLGIVLDLAGDRALAETRACVEGLILLYITVGLLIVRHCVVAITPLSSVWSQYVVAVAQWWATNGFTLVFE